MGQRIQDTKEVTSSADTSTARPAPGDVAELPPAALELAAKLFDLARAGETSTLDQYITAGVPPNLTNYNGDTLLMLASYHNHVDTVRMLLDKGADPNVVNGRGQSIIAGAVFKGYMDVVGMLYERGADKALGQPTAVECARMFRREAMLTLFGESTEGVNSAGVGFGIPGMAGLVSTQSRQARDQTEPAQERPPRDGV